MENGVVAIDAPKVRMAMPLMGNGTERRRRIPAARQEDVSLGTGLRVNVGEGGRRTITSCDTIRVLICIVPKNFHKAEISKKNEVLL